MGIQLSVRDQRGSLNVLVVPLVMSVLLLFAAIGFGAWAFTERTDYKDNVDEKVEAAVAVAVERAKTEKDNEFLQREKEPLKNYTSPAQYGSFSIKYPRTWSAYSQEQSNQLVLTMQPDVVSSNLQTPYALKVEVLSTAYSQSVKQTENGIKQGKLNASAVSLPKVPGVVGLRVDGQISTTKTGVTVYLPMRDKTIKVTTESTDKLGDFNNIILPNFEFTP
jgi:hypothetical protein